MKVEIVTSLKRRATEILGHLAESQEPVMITQHGKPAAYLLDTETFESMVDRIEILEGIARGEQAIDQGRVVSHQEAKNRMKRWLK